MLTTIPPTRDFPLGQWAGDASELITKEPTAFGATAEQAAQLAELASAYNVALQRAKAIETRGPLATERKDSAKKDLLDYARGLIRMIQANPDVSEANRQELGIRPRQPRTPSQPPTSAPRPRRHLGRGDGDDRARA